ncbi:MAG: hypothetical protein MK085_13735, partial [Phycisphaerales bacterium]|nr:hypothetical protein [Phycisphaerales bacterium]
MAFISPRMDEWIQLDMEDGSVLSRRPLGTGTIVGHPRYFLVAPARGDRPERLLSVGRDIVAIDPGNPDERVWTFSEANKAMIAERPERADRNGIRGRVQLLSDGFAVPFGDALALAGLEDGKASKLFAVPTGGNPLVLPDQFFVAGDDQLDAYMPVYRAVESIRSRLAEEPANVDQALALLDLARRAGDTDLAMEASELAVQSLESDADDQVRRDVLERLLGVLDEDVLDIAEAEQVHAFAERIAMTPEEQVRRLLSHGDWAFRHDRPRLAVESWRRILQSDDFARIPIEESGQMILSAASAAERRIRLIRSRDAAIAQWLDQETAREVDVAVAARATGESLLGIVRASPGAPSVARAGRRAIEIFRDEGRTLEAVGAALSLSAHLDPTQARDLLQMAADVAMVDDRPSLAARLLKASGAPSRTVQEQEARAVWPMVNGGEQALPEIVVNTNPNSVQRLQGRLPGRFPDAVIDAPNDRVLLVRDGKLQQRSASNLDLLWEFPIMDPEVRVLRYHPSLLLWEF